MPSVLENTNSARPLFRLAGVAGLVLLAYSLATMVLLIALGAAPGSAEEIFAMLQADRLAGFIRLDGLTSLVMPLYYLLFFALHIGLKKSRPCLSGFAALLGVAGVTLLLAAPSVASWLALSDKFALAADGTARASLLAAGEAVLATDTWHGTGPLLGGVLIQIAAVWMSAWMLRSGSFSKITAWTGVFTHGLDLLRMLVGFVFPAAGFILMAIAGPLYLVWFPLLARDFFRLAAADPPE